MIDVIKKSDLDSHIIHEGCDKGCGYIDERDLDNIHVFNTYIQDEVIAMLTELQLEIEELEKPRCHNASHADGCVSKWRVEGVIQQKIDKLRGNENGNDN